ncbi:hypothetical protein BX666DRAFT_1924169 [Dichotomocladium elegans]|nr:hypothetical protein BX666DRAFT_1924169 [Dichotomocladium elegans]
MQFHHVRYFSHLTLSGVDLFLFFLILLLPHFSLAMERQITIAIDPCTEETAKIIAWSADHFLRPNDHIRLVTVLVVDPELADHNYSITVDEKDMEALEKQLKTKLAEALCQIKEVLKSQGFSNVSTHVLVSGPVNPCQVLVDDFQKNPSACLIMGNRDLSGWKKFFLGSFSEQVQAHIHCPVLIVK